MRSRSAKGGMKFGRKMTPNEKIPLFIESPILIDLLFVTISLYFYYENYFCFQLNCPEVFAVV